MKQKRVVWVRRVIQVVFFLFIFTVVLSHFLEKRGWDLPWPVLHNFHAICPFGAVETAGRLVLEGNFIPKIHESNLWTFFGVSLVTITIGAAFCGYLCPLGSVQDWIGCIGKKTFKKKYNRFVGRKVDNILGYMRYGVLLIIMVQTTRMLTLVFQRVDPYYALFHFWTGDVFISAILVLGAILILSLFVERPWCRWFCPFGALQGVMQLLSPWKIRKNRELCTSCGVCSRACPMRIHIHEKSAVLDTRCNRCGKCLAACPSPGALTYSIQRKPFLKLKNSLVTGVVLLILFSTPILIARAGGLFKASNKPVISRGGLSIQEVKSSMTLKELAKGFDLEMETIISILEIPHDVPDSTRIFDLEEIDELMTLKTVKTELSEYLSKS